MVGKKCPFRKKNSKTIHSKLVEFDNIFFGKEYWNETDAVLKVTYTFPISATYTVIAFTATIGEKIIKGKSIIQSHITNCAL